MSHVEHDAAVTTSSYQMDMEEVFAGGVEKVGWPVTPYTIRVHNYTLSPVSESNTLYETIVKR